MKIWFTIAGTRHYLGQDFLEKGMKIRLEKEPDNKVDREAIKVMMKGLGHIGYVANSPYTVIGESWSAGRLYDKIGEKARGRVFMVMDKGVLCWLETEKNGRDRKKIGVKDAGKKRMTNEFIEYVIPDSHEED